MGHGDLWEQILWERERSGDSLLIRWVPFHLEVEGNVRADQLAELGRESHPNNHQPLPKRPRTEPQREALGLEEMSLDSEGRHRTVGYRMMKKLPSAVDHWLQAGIRNQFQSSLRMSVTPDGTPRGSRGAPSWGDQSSARKRVTHAVASSGGMSRVLSREGRDNQE